MVSWPGELFRARLSEETIGRRPLGGRGPQAAKVDEFM
jgi:hypothetical protein